MSDGYVDLKRAKSPKGDGGKGQSSVQEPDYPYGTRVQLEGDHAKKLYGDDTPDVGEEHEVHARAKVRSVSEDDGGGKRVELQITHMKRPKPKARSVRDDVEEAADKVAAQRSK